METQMTRGVGFCVVEFDDLKDIVGIIQWVQLGLVGNIRGANLLRFINLAQKLFGVLNTNDQMWKPLLKKMNK